MALTMRRNSGSFGLWFRSLKDFKGPREHVFADIIQGRSFRPWGYGIFYPWRLVTSGTPPDEQAAVASLWRALAQRLPRHRAWPRPRPCGVGSSSLPFYRPTID